MTTNTPYVPPSPQEPPREPWRTWVWRELQRLDRGLLVLVLLMVVGGLIMVISAGVPFAVTRFPAVEPLYFIKRHLLFLSLGLATMLVLAFWDYRHLLDSRLLLPITVVFLGLLLFVDVRNQIGNLVGRTLLTDRGSGQPGEFVKPLLAVYLAAWLSKRKSTLGSPWRVWFYAGAIIATFALLLLFQPDVSSAGTAIFLGFLILLLSGATWAQVLVTVVSLALISTVGLKLVSLVYAPAADRLAAYFQAWKDPTQVTGHVQQAFFAFLRGGWFGRGLGASQGKVYTLPLPHTDSVFAVIGEEFGIVGALVVLALFTAFLWRGYLVAARAPDGFGHLLAAGLTTWLVLEAYIHMGGMVGFLPQAGNALPFFSYGGSNLMASSIAVGLLFSISRLSLTTSEEVSPHAVVDLRGRYRRRHLSRPGRVSAASE